MGGFERKPGGASLVQDAQSGADLAPGKRTLVEAMGPAHAELAAQPEAKTGSDDHAQAQAEAAGPEPGPIAPAAGTGAKSGGEAPAGDAHDVPPASVLHEAASGLTTALSAEKPADKPADKKPAEQADTFNGTEDVKGKEKDRWAGYGKGDKRTYGWDLGGTHGVKQGDGAASAAIYAVGNVEGRYDSVQTYDAGILSFGVMQWTLHAGSLQKFLGYLKDKAGPDGKAAFQADFADKGIDVQPSGGEYQLWYNGAEYPLGPKGKGKAEIDKLVRQDKDTARKWSEIFHAAGADPRVQKAQFDRAKQMFHEAEGVKFGDKIVDQSLSACKKTFHAKYRALYGKAEAWMSASPKAAALYFSMRVNNPKYANAAFLKAIDGFYDAYGTDRTKWPATWGAAFGDLVAEKSKETLSNWGTHDGNEGRVDKTLRFWNKANVGAAAPAAHADAPHAETAQAEPAHAAATHHARPSTTPTRKAASGDAHANPAKADPSHEQQVDAQYRLVLQQFQAGHVDQAGAVKQFLAFDAKLNGGTASMHAILLTPMLLGELTKLTVARLTAQPHAQPAEHNTQTAQAVHSAQTTPAPTTQPAQPAAQVPLNTAGGKPFDKIYPLGKLPPVHVYTPPGGVHGQVEVFLFLHGMFLHHAKDPNPEADMHLARAMAQTGRNLVAIFPSAGMDDKVQWPNWEALNKENRWGDLIDQTLAKVGPDVNAPGPLTRGAVSVAGHSAGGSAIGNVAKQLGDNVHDMTLQDGGYGGSNFQESHRELVEWLLSGQTSKLLRVLVHGSPGKHQAAEGNVLKSHVNVDAIKKAAGDKPVTVTKVPGNHDARTGGGGMYLDHTLRIDGLPSTREVLVFFMPDTEHWGVRNGSTEKLITEGNDTQFEARGVAQAPAKPEAPKATAEPHKAAGALKPEAARLSLAPTRTKPPAEAKHDEDHHVEAAKKLADPAKLPADGAALHDGGVDKELGAGDEVIEQLDGLNHIKAVFPATAEGMVMAAMYELHRGDKRSMAEIMADHTQARWQQGKDHAVEQTVQGDWKKGRGLNDDGDATQHGQVVGHVDIHATGKKTKGQLIKANSPIGPIQAYKTAAGMGTYSQGKDPMWCGAFVTYCLARCGIDVTTLKYVPDIAGKIAKHKGQLFSFETTMTDDGGGDRHKAKYSYGGEYSEGAAGAGESKLAKKKLDSAETIDIRPGDIFYSAKHTGIIVGVNKQHDSIVLRTIEGNSNDAVVSNVKTIVVKNGRVTKADFGGWGRAAQFVTEDAPDNESWIDAGKGKQHGEGKTT